MGPFPISVHSHTIHQMYLVRANFHEHSKIQSILNFDNEWMWWLTAEKCHWSFCCFAMCTYVLPFTYQLTHQQKIKWWGTWRVWNIDRYLVSLSLWLPAAAMVPWRFGIWHFSKWSDRKLSPSTNVIYWYIFARCIRNEDSMREKAQQCL